MSRRSQRTLPSVRFSRTPSLLRIASSFSSSPVSHYREAVVFRRSGRDTRRARTAYTHPALKGTGVPSPLSNLMKRGARRLSSFSGSLYH